MPVVDSPNAQEETRQEEVHEPKECEPEEETQSAQEDDEF
jgi:hypothetical protein